MRNVSRLLVLILLTAPTALRAQESGHIGLAVGAANWDLSGTGQDVVYGLRVGSPITQYIGWELNVSYFHPTQDFGQSHFIIPELQFQLAKAFSGFTPYLGLGAGASIDKPEDQEILP